MKRATLIFLCTCQLLNVSRSAHVWVDSTPNINNQHKPMPNLVEQYDKRYDDGHYEYRYALSNGDTRYEHAYWQPTGANNKILARKGYYSYPLPDKKFLTVFYTSDQNGFQQELSSFSNAQPNLPRTMQVPSTAQKQQPIVPTYVLAHSNNNYKQQAQQPVLIAFKELQRTRRSTNNSTKTEQIRRETTTQAPMRIQATTQAPPLQQQPIKPYAQLQSAVSTDPNQYGYQKFGQQTYTAAQQSVNNQNFQQALLAYLASRVSAESPESYSSESHELFYPGLSGLGTGLQSTVNQLIDPVTGLAVGRKRIGNRPIWRSNAFSNPFRNLVY